MSNAKGLQLLAEKAVYLNNAEMYHAALRSFIVQKLSSPLVLKIKDVKSLLLEDAIQALLQLRERDENASYLPKGLVKNELNLTSSNADSRFICAALVRQTKQLLDVYSRIDWFSFASIVSPAYSETKADLMSNIKGFAQIKAQADLEFASCFNLKGDIGELDLTKFRSALNAINNLRYKAKGKYMFSSTTTFNPVVVFKNDSSTWQAILTESHFLKQK